MGVDEMNVSQPHGVEVETEAEADPEVQMHYRTYIVIAVSLACLPDHRPSPNPS